MKIILIMGLPGAGKTTLANELSKLIECKRLNADEIRKAAGNDVSQRYLKRSIKRTKTFNRTDSFKRMKGHVCTFVHMRPRSSTTARIIQQLITEQQPYYSSMAQK